MQWAFAIIVMLVGLLIARRAYCAGNASTSDGDYMPLFRMIGGIVIAAFGLAWFLLVLVMWLARGHT